MKVYETHESVLGTVSIDLDWADSCFVVGRNHHAAMVGGSQRGNHSDHVPHNGNHYGLPTQKVILNYDLHDSLKEGFVRNSGQL